MPTQNQAVGSHRARPVEKVLKTAIARPRPVVAVADDRRNDLLLAIAPHIEEPGPPRRTKPLVAIARVVGRADPPQVDRHHARRVGPVDQGFDPLLCNRSTNGSMGKTTAEGLLM